MLNVRVTPIDTGQPSPAEVIFGRYIATLLSQRDNHAPIEKHETLPQQHADMKNHYDQSSRRVDLPPLCKGHKIRIL